nr:MAG TPA: terminase large subunit [Caudoviricetes sp.]
MKEKVQEICNLIPAFEKEIDRTRGQTLEGKDYCKYVFKNGSYFDNIAARESSRGKRRHGGVIEECVGVDGNILSTVIIPKFWGLVA